MKLWRVTYENGDTFNEFAAHKCDVEYRHPKAWLIVEIEV
jgi:hypothetical protein